MIEKEVLNKIVELYKKKKSFTEISRLVGIDRHKVSCILQKEGLYTKRNSSHNTKIYDKDESVFEIIDTEEKAYWLGFLYADGYVNEVNNHIRIALKKEDYNHLVKFQDFIKTNTPIKYDSNRKCYVIQVFSVKIVQNLVRLGCHQAKSLTLEFPTEKQVPNHLIHHFMRGYFDGDGCITHIKPNIKNRSYKYQPSVYLLGTPAFIDEYEKRLLKVIGREKPNKRIKRKSWSDSTNAIQYGGSNLVPHIFNFLYKDATIFLDRKLSKFNAFDMQLPS